jgi:hypothetical protein
MLVVRQRIHNQNSANLLEAAQELLSSACLSIPHDQQGQLGMVSHLMLDLSLVRVLGVGCMHMLCWVYACVACARVYIYAYWSDARELCANRSSTQVQKNSRR